MIFTGRRSLRTTLTVISIEKVTSNVSVDFSIQHFTSYFTSPHQGVLMYFPHESGQETLPRPDDLEDDEQEPIFECFWQGRLAPLSYVHK